MQGFTRYTSADLAVVVPTRNRPHKLRNLLSSIVAQSQPVREVIIVSSGGLIEEVVVEFRRTLTVTHRHVQRSGQILQRNIALGCVDPEARLVATLDDDIVLRVDAIETMIEFWNETEPSTAGVGFNIVNEKVFRPQKLLVLLGLSDPRPGRVLRSGAATPICNVSANIKTQWLNGGATVWKKVILDEWHHQSIKGKWAVAEDLMFSYPIGLRFPLYICANAHARHEHIQDQFPSQHVSFLRGKHVSIWHSLFVARNPRRLSWIRYCWHFWALGILIFIRGALRLQAEETAVGAGMILGQGLALLRLCARRTTSRPT